MQANASGESMTCGENSHQLRVDNDLAKMLKKRSGAQQALDRWRERHPAEIPYLNGVKIGRRFENVDFNHAALYRAQLVTGGFFVRSNFYQADLRELRITGDARSAYLTGFLECNLEGTCLYKANCFTAVFSGSNLQGASLRFAMLNEVSFEKADLRGADFRDAMLFSARFGGADLRGADFEGACLYAVDFKEANVYGANFKNISLCEDKLCGCTYNCEYEEQLQERASDEDAQRMLAK